MGEVIMEAHGHNGQVELTELVVRIKRKGVLAFLTHGLKEDKEILISQISSIQFKKANVFVNGYIHFALVEGQEVKGGIFQGNLNENKVLFTVSQQPTFEAFRDELQKRLVTTKSESKPPSSLEKKLDMKNLTVCRHCEKEVARTANKCPHCGGDNPGLTQKQAETVNFITAVVGIVLLVLIIMWARDCYRAGDELEKAGRELMNAAEEMKKEFK